ncbi:hypothetical protein [Lysobacter sp. CA199]|uniref:hypothetical protein n=1 Tax=Lysobacter sp. CA199 TaxID=3455608 RepID=UPI003F8D0021
MKTYRIEEVHCGEEEDEYLWVTLGFVSEENDLDVLHIVCACQVGPQDRAGAMDRIYLERDDQSRGGYGGAERIVAGENSVEVLFNAAGLDQLEFGGSLSLQWPPDLAGKAEALRILARMREYECGGVVESA